MSRTRTLSRVQQLKNLRKEDLEAEARRVRELTAREQERLESLEASYSDAVLRYEERHRDPQLGADEIRLYADYFSQLHDLMDVQKQVVRKKLAELDHVQTALVEAYQEKKLIEVLRERVSGEEVRRQEKTEQKETDMLYLNRRHAKK